MPYYPEEDAKLRATNLQVRRGGNCPNSLQVLQELLLVYGNGARTSGESPAERILMHLVSPLPARDASATAQILASFDPPLSPTEIRGDGNDPQTSTPIIDFKHCLYREGYSTPASSHVLRSAATGSRTIVNHNELPEMTVEEFALVVESMARVHPADGRGGNNIDGDDDSGRSMGNENNDSWWWHFEGRIPDVTLQCMRILRNVLGESVRISVEIEKPGRAGLRELAAEADVVFYSKSWAEVSDSFRLVYGRLRGRRMDLESKCIAPSPRAPVYGTCWLLQL